MSLGKGAWCAPKQKELITKDLFLRRNSPYLIANRKKIIDYCLCALFIAVFLDLPRYRALFVLYMRTLVTKFGYIIIRIVH